MTVSTSKLKMLYIMKALLEQSDEKHIMSAEDLNRVLERHGFKADRKTIYNDIETLETYGLDIIQVRGGKKSGYYIGSREFELPELKLLVDAVQSSKFITEKKSKELIRKLEQFTSVHEATQLNRNVFIYNRPKTGNETIYYNVDSIHTAILHNRQILFKYTEWNMDKELVERKGGKEYRVSPWALTWDDENYYLIAYEADSEKIKHYRVDKMKNTALTEESRSGKKEFDGFDLADFSKKTFGMYGGKDENVRLICDKHLVGVIMDRFTKNTILIPIDEDSFEVTVKVAVSQQFFGWLTGLGDHIGIDGPEHVKKEYKEYLEMILRRY